MSKIGDILMEVGDNHNNNGAQERYAPKPKQERADHIASIMLGSVTKLSDITAAEIEKTATDLMTGAEEVATKLRELADAIRHHSNIAADHMNSFVVRANTVFQGAVELQARLRGETTKQKDTTDAATAEQAHEGA